MESIVIVATAPLLLLNMFGGVLGFIWLAVLGDWGLIGRGIAAMVLMPFLFLLAQLPGVGLSLLASRFVQRDWKLATTACIFLGSLWTTIAIAAWCILIALSSVDAVTVDNKIPVLLWGYVVAIAPLGYMASKERDNAFTGLQALLAQLFYISLVACWWLEAEKNIYLIVIGIMLFAYPTLAVLMGAEAEAGDSGK